MSKSQDNKEEVSGALDQSAKDKESNGKEDKGKKQDKKDKAKDKDKQKTKSKPDDAPVQPKSKKAKK